MQLQTDKKRLSDLESGYVDSLNAVIRENTALKERLAKIMKSAEWTARQVATTPEYADELLDTLLSEIRS